jgi:hypothetical protein
MLTPSLFTGVISKIDQYPGGEFTAARPFPHAVFDKLFPDRVAREIHSLFARFPNDYWDKSNDEGIEVKWRSKWQSEFDIPEPARELVRFFNSGWFLRALTRLTGIPHLIADPYYTGGGFNFIRRGGHLDVHVDGNWHDHMRVHRRLNLILYLNPNWQEDWGGQLQLFDPDGITPRVKIIPRGNRMLIFETHDYSFHGHPDRLTCPEHEGRSSIILYYYTAAPRPEEQIVVASPHSALWRSRDWHDKRGNKTRSA